MPYKRIMVPVINDDISLKTVREGIEIAKVLNARLCLLHILDETVESHYSGNPEENVLLLEKQEQVFITELLHLAIRENIKAEAMTTKISNFNEIVSIKINEQTLNWHADLIIIGAYSRKGFHRLRLGRTTESLLRITKIPVLVLHL